VTANDNTFKNLNALLAAFLDDMVNTNRVSGLDLQESGLPILLFDLGCEFHNPDTLAHLKCLGKMLDVRSCVLEILPIFCYKNTVQIVL
jgi:hypothetical protein